MLLLAYANVMNLMLSRARAHSRGAPGRQGRGRGRLVRQSVDRKPVMAVVEATLGLLVAQANVDLFSRFRIRAPFQSHWMCGWTFASSCLRSWFRL